MNHLNHDVLDTNFGRLVVELLVAGITEPVSAPIDHVNFAIAIAEATVAKLEKREDEIALAAKAAWDNRPKEPILWSPEEDERDRKGFTWSPEECAALVAAFNNGEKPAVIAARHLRTVNAIAARLADPQTGRLLLNEGNGYFIRATGERWL